MAIRTSEEWATLINDKIAQVKADVDHSSLPSSPFSSLTHPNQIFASAIDHTLLKPDATPAQIDELCDQAIKYKFKSCCVNGVNVKQVSERLNGSDSIPCVVIGFPLGAGTTNAKVFEAKDAISKGAMEIDMVLSIGTLKSKAYNAVFSDIQAVVQACHPVPVKVILETVFLTDEEKIAASFLSAEAGAAFVKTCTGFSGGGATREDVTLMWKTVKYKGGNVKVKASAGIRSFEKCMEMLQAGAERIGTSSGAAIMQKADVPAGTY
ncbi:deoxyribose-phosphate aldolase [Dendrothele bispora CBS 962.96]|uniref:deoxyribose-phosphate aldolase n=1 Tax=Dendrothele bispora (strain CBS 962.96) TaxID=1314807 RepID=A0A4V4HI75_DENBC|nr:deoxyribose-phosphate aldolase [Dendrothele bispora CBS 962.96]